MPQSGCLSWYWVTSGLSVLAPSMKIQNSQALLM